MRRRGFFQALFGLSASLYAPGLLRLLWEDKRDPLLMYGLAPIGRDADFVSYDASGNWFEAKLCDNRIEVLRYREPLWKSAVMPYDAQDAKDRMVRWINDTYATLGTDLP